MLGLLPEILTHFCLTGWFNFIFSPSPLPTQSDIRPGHVVFHNFTCDVVTAVSVWYDHRGWLGIKHQVAIASLPDKTKREQEKTRQKKAKRTKTKAGNSKTPKHKARQCTAWQARQRTYNMAREVEKTGSHSIYPLNMWSSSHSDRLLTEAQRIIASIATVYKYQHKWD